MYNITKKIYFSKASILYAICMGISWNRKLIRKKNGFFLIIFARQNKKLLLWLEYLFLFLIVRRIEMLIKITSKKKIHYFQIVIHFNYFIFHINLPLNSIVNSKIILRINRLYFTYLYLRHGKFAFIQLIIIRKVKLEFFT